mmetsp:Transcript_7849/g.13002  ORF Transcript_7849/g.13002 Transcript_7849/m.13002 type:complete len:303 (-) Transcript_7849:1471-2379(-)
MFIAKAVRDAKNETLANEFFLWEMDKEVNNCRDCSKPFSVVTRKHHCRTCGGIFCLDCTISNVEIRGEKMDRCCKGCIRGDAPGENVRAAVEQSLVKVDTRNGRRVTATPVSLIYGGEFDGIRKEGESAPESGYFEFVNKMGLFCCVKVVAGTDGSDIATLWEIPRPSYASVPPNGTVSGRFNPDVPWIEVTLLLSNSASSPDVDIDPTVVFDTTTGETISPCAYVANFRRYLTFRVQCQGRNVLLKYKGETFLEPRLGTSVSRVGIFSKITGVKGEGDKSNIDFDTNVVASAITLISASKR